MDLRFERLADAHAMRANYPLVRELSPWLTEADHHAWLERMVPHNYRQVVAWCAGERVGMSGYWLLTKFYCGPYLEVDNLVVAEACRSRGVGGALVRWLEEEARRHGCHHVMLDAYVENFAAHRFYHRMGFHARGFHYLKRL